MPARRRRDDGGDQVRLRSRSRHRDQDARGRARWPATLWTSAPRSWSPRPAQGVRGRSRRLPRAGVRRCCRRSPNAGSPMPSMRSAKASRSPDEVARVFQPPARSASVKLHADQLSDLGGAALAARFDAPADHLEYASERGVKAMAAAGTVAVLLPGALLRCASARSGRAVAPAWRAHRAGHRLQPRLLAHSVDPGHPQHGVHLFGLPEEGAGRGDPA